MAITHEDIQNFNRGDEHLDALIVRALLEHDPETGLISWRERPVEMFTDEYGVPEAHCITWNKRFANKPAGTIPKKTNRYRNLSIGINKSLHQATRLVWLYYHGAWPKKEIINSGDPVYIKLENLTDADRRDIFNAHPQGAYSSGVAGITWDSRREYWIVRHRYLGDQKFGGHHKNFDDAVEANRQLRETYSAPIIVEPGAGPNFPSKKLSLETAAKQAAAVAARRAAGLRNANLGRKLTPEHAAKIGGNLNRGKKIPPETIAKRTATWCANYAAKKALTGGRKLTPETIAKRTATWHANRAAEKAAKGDGGGEH